MRSNTRRDTAPELRLRRALHSRGHRYRVDHPIVVGGRRVRPDLVFTRRRLAVFVDGCYWHACPEHGRWPKDPTGYWTAKLRRNVARDAAVDDALRRGGWRVLRIWEHMTLEDSIAFVETHLRADHDRTDEDADAALAVARAQILVERAARVDAEACRPGGRPSAHTT